MNGKKLFRSVQNRMICGVCGGIGEYFNVDPTLIRLAVAVLTVVSCFSGILFYIIAAVIIPEDNGAQ